MPSPSAAFTSSDTWISISPRLIVARRITLVLAFIVVAAGVVALFIVPGIDRLIGWAATGVALIAFIWLWWLIGRRVRSYGYAERADDLLVRSGIMFRRLVIVPYGRMQLVDVTAGPIDRLLGVTTVQLHTAAATTDATIPGLEPAIAAALRDRLARQGEMRGAGL
jgi:membrane protein YdbS with pleckstrin-like domain